MRMPLPFTMTAQAHQQHQQLPPLLRRRTDRVILGVRLVPTIGSHDRPSDTFSADVGGDLRITYRITAGPEPQVVVLQIRPPTTPPIVDLHHLTGATR